jgi:hypothetical protein
VEEMNIKQDLELLNNIIAQSETDMESQRDKHHLGILTALVNFAECPEFLKI